METFAHLVSELFAALGYPPKEYFEPEDAVRAVRDSLVYYGIELGQSHQNQLVATAPFTPASREHKLPKVAGVPLWVERQAGVEPSDVWHYVPAVNLASVEEAAARGDVRCAFFAGIDSILTVRLSYLPSGSQAHQLRYDPDPSLAVTLADPVKVPPAFYEMYVARAVTKALPVMLLAAAKRKDPPTELQLVAWDAAKDAAVGVLSDFAPLWKQRRLGAPGAVRGRNRRPVLGRY